MEIIFQGIGVLILAGIAFFTHKYMKYAPDEMEYLPLTPPTIDPVKPQIAPGEDLPVKTTTMLPIITDTLTKLLPWNMTGSLSHANWHNVRVICDQEGLSHQMKEDLCATVWGESEFNVHARLDNKDKAGRVWSSDLGICQYNTHFHPEVVSLPYTPNPEKEIRAMCRAFKAGQAHQWVANSSGRYLQFKGKTL